MIQIAVLNESQLISDGEVQRIVVALSSQWNRDLKSVWNVDDATLTFVPAGQSPPAGTWWLVFLNDSDQANDLAYHELTDQGLPISKVFVRTIQESNSSVSVSASHELCEMAVDPWLNGARQDSQGILWATEICDPVEDDRYGYEIDGVLVSDFVTPDWFSSRSTAQNFDIGGHLHQAFGILPGGYAQENIPGRGWVSVGGLGAKAARRLPPKPGTRRARRNRISAEWTPSRGRKRD